MYYHVPLKYFILFKAAINVLIELVKRKESGEP